MGEIHASHIYDKVLLQKDIDITNNLKKKKLPNEKKGAGYIFCQDLQLANIYEKVLNVTDNQYDANQNHNELVLSHLLGQVL